MLVIHRFSSLSTSYLEQNTGQLGHAIGGGTRRLRMRIVVTSYNCHTVGVCFPFSCEMTTSFFGNSLIPALHRGINNVRPFIQELNSNLDFLVLKANTL